MRIISGSLKGKPLYSIRGTTTRPTSDRLRETIFNILSLRVQRSIVLDLFAGTGAFGLEALSRGAEHAVFIDKYKNVLSVIKKNIRACSMENRSTTLNWNITNNLNCLKPIMRAFDLIFMDPPYNKNTVKQTLGNLCASGTLAKDAYIIVEHSRLEQIPDDVSNFKLENQRKYGKTLVSFLNYMI